MYLYKSDYRSRRSTRVIEREPEPAFATRKTHLRYREEGTSSWSELEGTAMLVPDTIRVVHTFKIEGLLADTGYEFQTINRDIPAIYLTWVDNPSTTMVIHYHTIQPHPLGNYFKEFSDDIHRFKTMPSTLDRKVRFAQISDTHGFIGEQALTTILDNDVDCVIHSGDMATGDGGNNAPNTWYQLFESMNDLVNSDGYIIPVLPNIGNHEIWRGASGVEWTSNLTVGIKPVFDTHERGDAEWYYCFFPLILEQPYYNITFGDYADIWQLDPGITTFLMGEQSDWLVDTLDDSSNPHKLISYHYNPYHAGRRLDQNYLRENRVKWFPLYQDYKPLVLVGHDHVFVKTVPIYDDKQDDEKGVVIIGSGPTKPSGSTHGKNPHTLWWAETTRATEWRYYDFEQEGYTGVYPKLRPPHEADGTTFTNEEVSHVWIIEIESYNKRKMTAFDGNGDIIHTFEQTVDPYTTN